MSFTTQLPAAQEYVYVIHATGTNRIKLGFSTKPKERLAQLQTGSPFPLQMLACWPGSRARENRLHRYMAQFRQVGEWFEAPPFIGLKLWELVHKGEVTGSVKKKARQNARHRLTFNSQGWKQCRHDKAKWIKRLSGYSIHENQYGVQYLFITQRNPVKTSADKSLYPNAGFGNCILDKPLAELV